MISIRSEWIHQFRTVVRKGLGITKRKRGPNVAIAANDQGIRLRVIAEAVALEFSRTGEFPPVNFVAPFDLLRECTAGKNSEVIFRIDDGEIVMNWAEGGIPKTARFDQLEEEEFPTRPEGWSTNRPELMTSLRDACETADSESTRYALSDMRLRGSDGQLAATDGRQLFAHAGFNFPWEEPMLIPASRLFTCADLHTGSVVRVGKWEDQVVIQCEPWTIWLKIDQGSRFPDVDSLLRGSAPSATVLNLADSDAKFLQRSLKHLPGSRDFNAPATVDLNGAVAVRCKGEQGEKSTELILVQSKRDGNEVRFAVNRRYLARAVKLGFRRFYIGGPESPVVSKEGDRTYVWANLSKASAHPHDPEAVQIRSPVGSPASARKASNNPGTTYRTARTSGRSPASPATPGSEETILELERLVASLQESLSDIVNRIQTLKRLVDPPETAAESRFTKRRPRSVVA